MESFYDSSGLCKARRIIACNSYRRWIPGHRAKWLAHAVWSRRRRFLWYSGGRRWSDVIMMPPAITSHVQNGIKRLRHYGQDGAYLLQLEVYCRHGKSHRKIFILSARISWRWDAIIYDSFDRAGGVKESCVQ